MDIRRCNVLPGTCDPALQGQLEGNMNIVHVRPTVRPGAMSLHLKIQHVGSTRIETAGIRLELEPHRLAWLGKVDRLYQIQRLRGIRGSEERPVGEEGRV